MSTTRAAVPVAALAAGLALAACGGSGVPSTLHGTITADMLNALAGPGGGQNCILELPDHGSEITLRADGVAVGTAQLSQGGFRTRKVGGLGEVCSETFTIPNVPGSAKTYSITIHHTTDAAFGTYGCNGTVYYTPARLASGKPLALSCS